MQIMTKITAVTLLIITATSFAGPPPVWPKWEKLIPAARTSIPWQKLQPPSGTGILPITAITTIKIQLKNNNSNRLDWSFPAKLSVAPNFANTATYSQPPNQSLVQGASAGPFTLLTALLNSTATSTLPITITVKAHDIHKSGNTVSINLDITETAGKITAATLSGNQAGIFTVNSVQTNNINTITITSK
ncbi:MAG: hypothetical protein K0U12_03300 [Gammaproteobacteria bacterium]|nr:hypothetical protein [Gammaproteobacteria bacterium]